MDKLIRKEDIDQAERGKMLRLKKGEQMPEEGRWMTNEEVLNMQMKVITSWKPHSEMWPFSWGLGMLGGASALTGAFVNNFCRRKLGLMNFARTATYFPTVALPVVLGTFFHKVMVTDRILVGDSPCTVCAATRSGAIQSLSSGVYPMILGPLVCVAMARKYHTYPVPNLKNWQEVLPFLRKTAPVTGVGLFLMLANFALGMAIAERETYLFAKYLNPSRYEEIDSGFKWGD